LLLLLTAPLSRRGLLRARSNLDLTLAVDEEEFNYEIRGGAFERTRFPGSRRWIRAAKAPEEYSRLLDEQFSLTISDSTAGWTKFLAAMPEPMDHDLAGSTTFGSMSFKPSSQAAAQAYRPAIHRLIDLLREELHGEESSSRGEDHVIARPQRKSQFDAAVGRYVYLVIEDVEYRVFFEESGNKDGPALLCQHTAGTDGRQFRHVLEDEQLQQTYRLITYDLPYHGRSLPPTEVAWWQKEYRLSRQFFMAVPLALSQALELDRPVFMGSSIGGMLAVDLALYHPTEFRAVIGLEAALATTTREAVDKEPYAEMTQDELQEGIHGVMRHPRANGDGNGMWMCKRQPGPLACFAELVFLVVFLVVVLIEAYC